MGHLKTFYCGNVIQRNMPFWEKNQFDKIWQNLALLEFFLSLLQCSKDFLIKFSMQLCKFSCY